MKNIYLIFLFVFIATSCLLGQDLNIDQILEKYYQANNLDKLHKTNTIIMSGHITRQDYMPFTIYRMQPDMFKMEFDIQDITAYQVYDGKVAWMTTPWTGNTKPQLMQADAEKDIKVKADYDGVLYNYKEKKHIAELIGKEKYNDLELYKIKLTLKDSNIVHFYIDTKDFLMRKSVIKRISRGNEIEITTLYSDYRKVEEIPFSFKNENQVGDQIYSTVEIDNIEINKPITEEIFSMPE